MDNTSSDGQACSALEDKVWCMEELRQALWRHDKDITTALTCINMAISYDDARNFSEGLACVQIGDKWGYMVLQQK